MERHKSEVIDLEYADMMLSQLLDGVAVSKMFQTLYGQMVVTHDIQVNHICYDSRRVRRGDLFAALRGSQFDGHRFISDAVAAGASAVVIEDDDVLPDSFFMHNGVVKIVVPDTRIALARMSTNFYHNPSNRVMMVGVTGTNGKTTTTHIIKTMFEATGSVAGLIGTIEYKIGNKIVPATHTTPESVELNELLDLMANQGCRMAVMEVSSHALHQHRVDGIDFSVAVFTNLTQDHLDYHGSMEEYFKAKRALFESLDSSAYAIVNVDDAWGEKMMSASSSNKVSYGISARADVIAQDISLSMNKTSFTVVHEGEKTRLESTLIGKFNVSNLLAAFSTGIALGIPKQTMQDAIYRIPTVRGRFEQIAAPEGWTVVIDYAHTPDALSKAITAIRDIFGPVKQGKLITVFGCGGDRDRMKRPQMGKIATEYSDTTIITSDNPRNEPPEEIINEIMAGVKSGTQVVCESDRRNAIIKGLGLAKSGDVVLIAGKGHEEYQIIGGEKIHFSDREIVEEYLRATS